MQDDINVEELKIALQRVGLTLEHFSEHKDSLLGNNILERYKELQRLKIDFDDKKYVNNEYYDKLEFKSIVLNNKIKNIINTREKWLLEKNTLIKYYKKEIAIADRYAEINEVVENSIKELNEYIDTAISKEYKASKKAILKNYYVDYGIIAVSSIVILSSLFV